jgi:hypothetical protein
MGKKQRHKKVKDERIKPGHVLFEMDFRNPEVQKNFSLEYPGIVAGLDELTKFSFQVD